MRRLVERLLPWYDPARELRRDARTEAIRQRSIDERMHAEKVRAAYRAYGDRVRR